MSQIVSANIALNLANLNFSFDELIISLKDAFDQEGLPGITSFICSIIDNILSKDYERVIGKNKKSKCCPHYAWNKNGSRYKKIQTSLGKVNLKLSRMICIYCSKSHTPFCEYFNLTKNHSLELEKTVFEELVDNSFRRTVNDFFTHRKVKLNKSTMCKWVHQSDMTSISMKAPRDLMYILADGTGYKSHPDNENTELKIMIGIDSKNKIIPFGAWIGKTWKQIGRKIEKENSKKDIMFKPIATTLLSDGEIALVNGLKHLTHHTQRCIWHWYHDFDQLFKGSEEDLIIIKSKMFELANPQEKLEQNLSKDEYQLTLLREIFKSKKSLGELSEELKKNGERKAATYIKNSTENIFTHLMYLLKTGELHYQASSRIERLMRELARRFKRIAHNWSERGAENMARIMLKLILQKDIWENEWKEKLGIVGELQIKFKECSST